ncbi:MAG: ABC transporter ATP-binding protein/permease [Desulfovibrio sp.]|uniref:ABC transporter ATP-binding protein/permease n=1 Tax=Desulfovibrio sp. 7SRBS1 TaxID=3378064 RepID=UPI003B3EB264
MKLQVMLLVVIVVTVFARVLPLELQKKIINEAINYRRIDLLMRYCALFLGAVIVSGGLKYVIGIIQTYLGQNTLTDMRKELYAHLLTLPISYYRKTQSGMVVSSLINVLAPVGDFVGMALAVPLTNLLTLLAFGIYLFYLNWLMACISLAIYPFVVLIIPLLQKRTNLHNKRRVDATRDLSNCIAEAVTGIHEIHGNGAYTIERSKFNGLADKLLEIRIIWNLYKMGTKAFNNFMINLAPFALFLVGGWLIIKGHFDIGSLVAFLSAQEKLYDPWKELMEFYQTYQNAKISYDRTMEYFDFAPEHKIVIEGRAPYQLSNDIQIENLSFVVDGGIRLLRDVSLDIKPGEHIALVGFSGSGKSTLALCIGQLNKYSSGHLRIGGQEVADMSKRDIVENMGFVSQSPFVFTGTIRENLVYSCEALMDEVDGKAPTPEEVEARLPSLDDQISMLQQTGIFVDVLRFGLNAFLDEDADEELAEKLIPVRRNFQTDFGEELGDIVEFFNESDYLYHSSVATNIIFGHARDKRFSGARLVDNQFFHDYLDEVQLRNPLLTLGASIASATVDILGALPAESVFFEQSPIPAEDIDLYKELVRRMDVNRLHHLDEKDQKLLLRIALNFRPGKHKMVRLSQVLENMLLQGRVRFREKMEQEFPDAVIFYDRSEYIHSRSILDNILFGKSKSDASQVQERISQSIIQLLIEEDLLETIVARGMEFQVGSKGDKLSGGQRQKLAIARVFLKNPRIILMDEATSALDNKSQARVQNVLDTRLKGKTTVIAVVHRLDIIKTYDKVAVMKAGKIVECGPYDDLMARKGSLYELVHGNK